MPPAGAEGTRDPLAAFWEVEAGESLALELIDELVDRGLRESARRRSEAHVIPMCVGESEEAMMRIVNVYFLQYDQGEVHGSPSLCVGGERPNVGSGRTSGWNGVVVEVGVHIGEEVPQGRGCGGGRSSVPIGHDSEPEW